LPKVSLQYFKVLSSKFHQNRNTRYSSLNIPVVQFSYLSDLYQPSPNDRRSASTPSKGSILASVPQSVAPRLSSSGQYWSNDSMRSRGNTNDSSSEQHVYSQHSFARRNGGDDLHDRTSERMSRRHSPNGEFDSDIHCSSVRMCTYISIYV